MKEDGSITERPKRWRKAESYSEKQIELIMKVWGKISLMINWVAEGNQTFLGLKTKTLNAKEKNTVLGSHWLRPEKRGLIDTPFFMPINGNVFLPCALQWKWRGNRKTSGIYSQSQFPGAVQGTFNQITHLFKKSSPPSMCDLSQLLGFSGPQFLRCVGTLILILRIRSSRVFNSEILWPCCLTSLSWEQHIRAMIQESFLDGRAHQEWQEGAKGWKWGGQWKRNCSGPGGKDDCPTRSVTVGIREGCEKLEKFKSITETDLRSLGNQIWKLRAFWPQRSEQQPQIMPRGEGKVNCAKV